MQCDLDMPGHPWTLFLVDTRGEQSCGGYTSWFLNLTQDFPSKGSLDVCFPPRGPNAELMKDKYIFKQAGQGHGFTPHQGICGR